MKKIFAVLAAIFLLVVIACSGGGGGSSSSDTPAVKSDLQGTWSKGGSSITFMSDKTYTIDTSSKGDTTDAWGTYSITGNQLTMTDGGGTSSCYDTITQNFNAGQYTYSISGNTLTLTLVSDSCSERATTLSGSSLTGQSTSDTTAPSVPINLSATAATTSQINLSWSAASDDVDIAGYKVFRNGTLITTTAGTVFSDTWLTDNTTYSYTVSAYDAAGNDSGKSISANATTAASSTPTYSVSGKISGAVVWGVTVTITGSSSTRTTTDSNGNYSFSGAANGSYTVMPSLTGYTFSPSSTVVNVSGTDKTNIDFTANANVAPTYTISGTVSGAVLSGVTITLTGTGSSSTTTDVSGNYSFNGVANGSYTVTPSKTGYSFNPASIYMTVNNASITGQNFTATDIVVLSSAKEITAYSLAGVEGTINEAAKTISVTMPTGTDVMALVATFTKTGVSVKVGSTVQVSGTTANDFTYLVTYTVTAADASTQNYAVTVIIEPANKLATAVTVSMTPNTPAPHVGVYCTATTSITGSYTVTDADGGSVIVMEWYDNGVLRQTNTITLLSGETSGTDTLPGRFAYHNYITFKVTADGVVSNSVTSRIL